MQALSEIFNSRIHVSIIVNSETLSVDLVWARMRILQELWTCCQVKTKLSARSTSLDRSHSRITFQMFDYSETNVKKLFLFVQKTCGSDARIISAPEAEAPKSEEASERVCPAHLQTEAPSTLACAVPKREQASDRSE